MKARLFSNFISHFFLQDDIDEQPVFRARIRNVQEEFFHSIRGRNAEVNADFFKRSEFT